MAELFQFPHTLLILPRLNKKRDFRDETEMPFQYYFSLFKNSDLENRVFYLNWAKFTGYDENEKVPPLDRGTFYL